MLCPFAENSWCKYQLAIWHQEPVPHPPNYLSEQAVTYIQGLFTANLHAESAIKKRFVKRQMRTQTRRLQTRRDGAGYSSGYSSGKFSGAQKTNTDESGSDEGGTNMSDAVASTTQVSSPLDKECCVVCLVKTPPGVEEIGLGMVVESISGPGLLVTCSRCKQSYYDRYGDTPALYKMSLSSLSEQFKFVGPDNVDYVRATCVVIPGYR